jgi:hypothetical protein
VSSRHEDRVIRTFASDTSVAAGGVPIHAVRIGHLDGDLFDARWMWQMNASYLRLHDAGITPEFCLDHGMTFSYYYSDPDGNFEFVDSDRAMEIFAAGITFDQIDARARLGEPQPVVDEMPGPSRYSQRNQTCVLPGFTPQTLVSSSTIRSPIPPTAVRPSCLRIAITRHPGLGPRPRLRRCRLVQAAA